MEWKIYSLYNYLKGAVFSISHKIVREDEHNQYTDTLLLGRWQTLLTLNQPVC